MPQPIAEQLAVIRRGVSEIISEQELREKLVKKPRLTIKAGFDPTAPDLHLGHTVLLRKLRQFQDLGHEVIFLIGDATALVGDPSGQSKMRKLMTDQEIEANALTYHRQVKKILEQHEVRQRRNSEWFVKRFGLKELVELMSKYTVARLIERDDFQKRMKAGQEVSMLELFYPLMQGYDSVMLKADVELGGTDQKFNLLVGRNLQRAYSQEPQVVITMPLLVGLDGVSKMSKSLGNHIGINEPPEEMFGKLMSISDVMMWDYFTLLTDEDVAAMKRLHPMEAKKRLARTLVETYHPGAGQRAQQEFTRVFSQHQLPNEMPEKNVPRTFNVVEFLFTEQWVKSKNEARRLLDQKGVKLDNQTLTVPIASIPQPSQFAVLQVGSGRFVKLVVDDKTAKSS